MRSIMFSLSLVFIVFSCGEEKNTSSKSPVPAGKKTSSEKDPEDTSPQVDGDTEDKKSATDPVAVQPIQLSISYYHACILSSRGEVKCWGRGERGQLGTGDTKNVNLGDEANEMGENLAAISLGKGRTAKAVSAGWEHSCAILDNNTLKCWGFGNGGRLGQGDEELIGDAEDEIKDLASINLGQDRTAKTVSAGYRHTCAILDNEMVKCWGIGTDGVLGNGKADNLGDDADEMANLPFVDFGEGRTAQAISAGYSHTCAILDGGTVKCWGNGGFGKLGQGSSDNIGDNDNEVRDAPAVDLGTNRTATAISAGWEHTCAILDDGTVKCWGNGIFGRLGYDNNEIKGDDSGEMGENLLTVNLGTDRTATAISAGHTHTCALLDNNTVKCWGRGDSGELGQGSGDTLGHTDGHMAVLEAIDLGEGRKVKAIASGYRYNCALLDNAEVKCWGLGDEGQLGNGKTDNLGDAQSEMGEGLPVVDLGFNTKS